MTADERFRIEPSKTALIIQDMQNDVLSDGGAWADSGAPLHAKSQNVVANVALLAAEARRQGDPSSMSTTSWSRERRGSS